MVYWISGSLTGLTGVILVRFVSPVISGVFEKFILISGYVMVIAGIGIMACATKCGKDEAFLKEPTKKGINSR
jgi:hypothetical protein